MATVQSFSRPQAPAQKKNDLGQILQIGGAVAGGIFGGVPGAMAGSQLGGMAGGMLDDTGGPGPSVPQAPQVASDGGAMSRRMAELNDSPQMQIRQGIDSLKYVQNPEQRMELAKPLLQADYLAKKGQV